MVEQKPNHEAADAPSASNIEASKDSVPLLVPVDTVEIQPTDSSASSKPCSLCQRRRDVLIRCQIDETKTWNFICPGKCWYSITGGRTFASEHHPHYVYGGTWKNRHAYVSGKIKGKAKELNKNQWNGAPGPHRMRGSRGKKRSKKDSGQSKKPIGADDGGSDIEVSELSDWSGEFEYHEKDGKDDNGEKESTTGKKPEVAATTSN